MYGRILYDFLPLILNYFGLIPDFLLSVVSSLSLGLESVVHSV